MQEELKWANARFKYGNQSFWYKGYYVDTVGKNTKMIQECIVNQLKQDKASEQLILALEDLLRVNRKTCSWEARVREMSLDIAVQGYVQD